MLEPGLDGQRSDLVWVFDRTEDGWAFKEEPQLLLSDDSQVGDRH